MKTKKNFTTLANLKIFIVLPLFAVAVIVFSSCGKNKTSEAIPTELAPPPPPPPVPENASAKVDGAYQVVDEMPVFPGGDEALLNYIAANTLYPKESKEKGIHGKVIAKFMVKEDGTVSAVSILKSADPLLDAESIRVVSTLPKFTPGKLKGKNVPVWFMIPITFSLK